MSKVRIPIVSGLIDWLYPVTPKKKKRKSRYVSNKRRSG